MKLLLLKTITQVMRTQLQDLISKLKMARLFHQKQPIQQVRIQVMQVRLILNG